eukprot:12813451-Prorocentrum_lima.AAC.1
MMTAGGTPVLPRPKAVVHSPQDHVGVLVLVQPKWRVVGLPTGRPALLSERDLNRMRRSPQTRMWPH